MSQKEKVSAWGRGFARVPNVVFLVIELLVLLAVLFAAWLERRAMPLVPIADPDTWSYLNPALSWLSGLGLQQTDGRDWLYPALLALFLKTTGSFAGIVLWQRFLGISSGVLMAVTWRCWISTLPFQRWARFPVSLVGALPILVQLLNPHGIFFEMSTRPEAVLSFFVYAQLACLMGYYKYRWQAPNALRSIVLGAAAILLSYACFLLKPSWLLAFVITAVPVFVGAFGSVPSLKTRLLTPALGIVLSLLILWFPSAAFLIKDRASVTMLPDALFAVHARLIDKMLDARLAALSDSDPEKAKLQALVTVLKSELQIAETTRPDEKFGMGMPYAKLGFNPDHLMHSETLTAAIYRYTGNDDKKFRAFCISCYRDAALHEPLDFARKILTQFNQFLFPGYDTFYKNFRDFSKCYRDSAGLWGPSAGDGFSANVREMFHQYRADIAVQAGSGLRLNGKSMAQKFCQTFTWLALPLEIVFLLTFVGSLVWPRLRDLRAGGWAAFSLFSAPLGNAVTVCVLHALDIDRYRRTYGGPLFFALTAMTVFASMVIARSFFDTVGVSARGTERS